MNFMNYRGGEREPTYDPKTLNVGDRVIIGSGGVGRLVERGDAEIATIGRVWVHIKPPTGKIRRFRLDNQREDHQFGCAARFYTLKQDDYHQAHWSAIKYLSRLGVRLDWDSKVSAIGLARDLYGIHGGEL